MEHYDANASYVIKFWVIGKYIYCLYENALQDNTEYTVKISPKYGFNKEFRWLEDGPWETESGAAWAILNSLDESE